jgi:hypothetical protein
MNTLALLKQEEGNEQDARATQANEFETRSTTARAIPIAQFTSSLKRVRCAHCEQTLDVCACDETESVGIGWSPVMGGRNEWPLWLVLGLVVMLMTGCQGPGLKASLLSLVTAFANLPLWLVVSTSMGAWGVVWILLGMAFAKPRGPRGAQGLDLDECQEAWPDFASAWSVDEMAAHPVPEGELSRRPTPDQMTPLMELIYPPEMSATEIEQLHRLRTRLARPLQPVAPGNH